ncbi:MtrAB system histidine kinase MtrB [Rothia sp. ZJ1223]|uniref:MtrAB system histidine kinase MtrB n=1 Tax=Rothia sp. ZJ1223 TaxID=2811098 RepID=UPI001959EF56|nr:MtrAB system histidine kinase MtrB [Rothia sp. ZJ1223]MBM7050849.1 HAMP domain-containing histidine kinase [Rothia sp. ZJ1223]
MSASASDDRLAPSRRFSNPLFDFSRRWQQSLQFRAVSIAIILLMITFLVVGAFLANQIANSLFRGRLDQALEESSAGFANVQSVLDSSDAVDRNEIEAEVRRFLTVLETGSSDAQREWVLLPTQSDSTQNFIPAQAQNIWMDPANIPADLQQMVTTADGIYWQSAQMQVMENQQPVPVVVVGTRISIPQSPEYGLYLIYDFSNSQETATYINMVMGLGFGIMLIVVVSIVWAVTRAAIKPISSTAISAEKLAAGNLDQRMQVTGKNEATRLGHSFNKMADSLQDQISRLETLSTMQQRFVSDVSHELRTPLTTVRMAAEMLYNAREGLDPLQRRSSELLYNQVDRFDNLLADLLEISRFDAGSATLDLVPVDALTVVRETVEVAQPHLARVGVELTVHTDLTEQTVEMDHRRIERVLRNLIFNAIEYSEGKPIDIYIAASSTALGIAVRDHGVGLTEEQLSQVFNRFWRADPSRKRTLGGTGLGLAISAEDVRLHGGALEVWGKPGEGACFRITIPLKQGVEMGNSPVLLSGESELLELTAFTGSIPQQPAEIAEKESTEQASKENASWQRTV